jgi:hypothetical protein
MLDEHPRGAKDAQADQSYYRESNGQPSQIGCHGNAHIGLRDLVRLGETCPLALGVAVKTGSGDRERLDRFLKTFTFTPSGTSSSAYRFMSSLHQTYVALD